MQTQIHSLSSPISGAWGPYWTCLSFSRLIFTIILQQTCPHCWANGAAEWLTPGSVILTLREGCSTENCTHRCSLFSERSWKKQESAMLKWSLSFCVELLSVFLDQIVSSSHAFFLLVLVAVTNCRSAEIWQHVKWEKAKKFPEHAFAKKHVWCL